MLINASDADADTHVDFVPMVDVLFNLLIFFLIATSMAQAEREMAVALPHAAASAPISSAMREIVINVTRDGAMIVNTKTVDEASLLSMLKAAVSQNAGQKVNVRGDRDAAYGLVARALDLCKQAGIAEPFLQTIPTR